MSKPSTFLKAVLVFTVLLIPLQTQADSAKPIELLVNDTDLIQPVKIIHNFEEIIIGGRHRQQYNYFVYYFEKHDAYIHARAYFDESGLVSVYGPFSDSSHQKRIEAPKLYNEVLEYLKRRFREINSLGADGYETIWMQSELD